MHPHNNNDQDDNLMDKWASFCLM